MAENHTDVKIKTWGEGPVCGTWIKLDLIDTENLEFFKKNMGLGFHMILVPIDCDDTEESKPEPKEVAEVKKKGMKLSNEAHMMIKEGSFIAYLYGLTTHQYNYNQADDWLKEQCNINSKSDLDNEVNNVAIRQFLAIRDQWRKYVNRVG